MFNKSKSFSESIKDSVIHGRIDQIYDIYNKMRRAAEKQETQICTSGRSKNETIFLMNFFKKEGFEVISGLDSENSFIIKWKDIDESLPSTDGINPPREF